jgi:Uridine kinase
MAAKCGPIKKNEDNNMPDTYLRQSRQTLNLGIVKVVRDLFPENQLKIAYSVPQGVFCKLVDSALSEREVRLIETKLNNWVMDNSSIEFLAKTKGYYQYELGDAIVKSIYPANSHTTMIGPFKIIPFCDGFIVEFDDLNPGEKTQLVIPEKLSATYDKTQKWLRNIRIELLSDVNAYIESGRSNELIGIAEALQEKEISDIADVILQQKRSVKGLLISGPSSSGKTSFAQRISAQLRVNGMRPLPLSLDNYYLDRDKVPKDEDGKYDFECLEALDLALLQDHISRLISGETVETPIFDFTKGRRSERCIPMHLGDSELLVIEGIHALNPGLLPGLERNIFFRLYISALFELNVDLTNRIPTTEVRLIRRLVRDDRFRGTGASETFDRWASVRKGEYNFIFKHQEEADMMFNSSLIYELNALRPFAEASLNKMPENSPHILARDRLLNTLSFAQPMDTSKVPFNSILREFIGGSIYFE